MNAPLLSIITPSLNQGRFIRVAIESVRNQDIRPVEHLIMDGGSTDETLAIVQEYPEVICHSEPDHGQSDALNKALALARAPYVGWINADDWYEPGIFGEVVRGLERAPLVMGWCERHDEGGNPLEVVKNEARSWFDLMKYWVHYAIPDQPAIFMRRELLEEITRPNGEYFDPSLHYCMDYDLWLRAAHRGAEPVRVERVLAHARAHPASKTGSDMGALYREAALVFQRHEEAHLFAREVSEVPTLSALSVVVLGGDEHSRERTLASLEANTASSQVLLDANGEGDALAQEGTSGFDPALLRSGALLPELGRIVVLVDAGVSLAPDFLERALEFFESPSLGAILPWECAHSLHLTKGDRPIEPLDIGAVLNAEQFPGVGIFRRIALEELGSVAGEGGELLQEIFVRMRYRGWGVAAAQGLSVAGQWRGERSRSDGTARERIVARIKACDAPESFAEVRARGGFSFSLAPVD